MVRQCLWRRRIDFEFDLPPRKIAYPRRTHALKVQKADVVANDIGDMVTYAFTPNIRAA